MHCFNNNYVIPAAVSFFSMLENANKNFEYFLYVLHSDITDENQKKLTKLVSLFSNAKIEFINTSDKFQKLFNNTKTKEHYSKEMYYKFLAPDLFPQYDKIMITDVDVVFLGDISEIFNDFDEKDDKYLVGSFYPMDYSFFERYTKNFTKDEIERVKATSAGYWIFNLKNMRKDNMEEKFIEYAEKNAFRLIQPEQDTVNMLCYSKIKNLPKNAVVGNNFYNSHEIMEMYCKNNLCTGIDEFRWILENPIQLHYVGGNKPWIKPDTEKSEVWFEYLAKTPFYIDYLNQLANKARQIDKRKVLLNLKLPFSSKNLVISKERV